MSKKWLRLEKELASRMRNGSNTRCGIRISTTETHAMKQVIGIFAALVLVPSMQAHAWLGGPFSSDTYQSNGDDGIYEAVATTSNGLGMYRWAVFNNNPGGVTAPNGGALNPPSTSNVEFGGLIGTVSPNVWYYKGLVYYGRCFGTVNSGWNGEFGIVSVVANASADGSDGSGNAINGSTSTFGLAGPGTFNTPTAVPPDVPTVEASQFGAGNNKGWCNSNFLARIISQYPNKRFKGKGTVSFFGAPDSSYDVNDNTVTTTTVVPPPVDTNGDGTNDAQSQVITNAVRTIHVEMRGDSTAFSQYGHQRKFLVFGSQVSTQVVP
jgi:hypothetical protein